METGKTVTKVTDFAANAIPGVNQYQNAKPSDLLKMIMAVDNGNLDFSAEQTERLMARMPDQMVGMKANSRGALEFSVYKKADFLSPSNPAGSSIKGAGLVPILVSDVIQEGAMPFCSARKILEVWRANSGAEQIPFFSARKGAKSVAPNADALDLTQTIGKKLAVVKEYKLMCTLDKGLLADASVDIKAAAFREMGASMEIALNQEAVTNLLTYCYGTDTTATAGNSLKGLNSARGQVGKNGFRATGALMAPMFEADALNAMAVPAYNERAQGVGENGDLIRFAGMDLGCDGSTGLDWASANDIGAIVVDKYHSSHIVIREDLGMGDTFDNITKYALQPTVVSRFCVAEPVDDDKSTLNNKGATVRVKLTS